MRKNQHKGLKNTIVSLLQRATLQHVISYICLQQEKNTNKQLLTFHSIIVIFPENYCDFSFRCVAHTKII